METILAFLRSWAQEWMATLWSVSIQTAVLGGIALIITAATRKSSPRFHYYVWLIVIVRATLPFNLTFPELMDRYSGAVQFIPIPLDMPYSVAAASAGDGMASLPEIAALAWMAVMLFITAAIIWKTLLLRRTIGSLCPVADGAFAQLHEQVCLRMGFRKAVPLFTSEDDILGGPAVIGLLRPRVYLPHWMLANWSAAGVEPVLIHELAHIRRRDLLINYLQIAVQTVYFFHPFIWLANRRLRALREDICDDTAIAALDEERSRYGESILRIIDEAFRQPSLGLSGIGFVENGQSIKRRIRRIMNRDYRIMRGVTFSSVLALIMVIFVGIALAIQGEGSVADSLKIVKEVRKEKKKEIEVKIIKKIKALGKEDSIVTIATAENDLGDMDTVTVIEKDGKKKIEDIEVKILKKIKALGKGDSVVTIDSTVRIVTRDGRKLAEYLPLANQPRIKGGLQELAKHLAYPDRAKLAGIEGNVLVQVLVGADGKPGETKLIKGIGYGCDEAATEAVKKLEFIPAVYEGENVAIWFAIPIRFGLPRDNENQDEAMIPPFLPLENQPIIKGGLQSLAKLLTYPEKAKEAGIEGTVLVQALVGADGSVKEAKIHRGIGHGCDEAAIEAVKKLEFTPATQNGKSIAFWFTIPVRFQLADNAK